MPYAFIVISDASETISGGQIDHLAAGRSSR